MLFDLVILVIEKFYIEGVILFEIVIMFDKCYRFEDDVKNLYCLLVFVNNEEFKNLLLVIVIICEIDFFRDEVEDYV